MNLIKKIFKSIWFAFTAVMSAEQTPRSTPGFCASAQPISRMSHLENKLERFYGDFYYRHLLGNITTVWKKSSIDYTEFIEVEARKIELKKNPGINDFILTGSLIADLSEAVQKCNSLHRTYFSVAIELFEAELLKKNKLINYIHE